MSNLLLFALLPTAGALVLVMAQSRGTGRRYWVLAALMGLLQAILFGILLYPFAETSLVTAVLCGLGTPLLSAAAIALLRRLHAPWPARWLLGAGTWSLTFIPVFALSCYVALAVPWVRGCFF